MVTRTIKVTKVDAILLNLETEKLYRQGFTLSGYISKQPRKMKREIEKRLTETQHFVKVENAVETVERYGMTEDKFIAYADILPAFHETNNL